MDQSCNILKRLNTIIQRKLVLTHKDNTIWHPVGQGDGTSPVEVLVPLQIYQVVVPEVPRPKGFIYSGLLGKLIHNARDLCPNMKQRRLVTLFTNEGRDREAFSVGSLQMMEDAASFLS